MQTGAGQIGSTLGVEEEYHLVDAETFELADMPEVVAGAIAAMGDEAQGEISTSQLEIATPVCESLAEVRTALQRIRADADRAARQQGCRILAAGTHPTATWHEQRLTTGVRYLELFERWGLLALQQMITGCHVHVGVPDPETAVRAMDHLRADLPALIALAGSSPFWEGVDTGYASYRTQWFARWPVTGTPDVFGSRKAYDELVADLVETGMIDDASHLYWDVRPSIRFPTLEIRVADTCPSLDDVVLHAALARSLVRVAADGALRGEAPPALRAEVVRGARWRAARFGLEDRLLDTREHRLRPAGEVVRNLLGRLRDDLEDLGDWDEVSALAEQALARGSSAARQRALALEAEGDLSAVAAALVEETVR
ncbi:MAG: putative Carboxylate-amine ligase [Frankiales bacterium]|nr:putative Carboxylate-amine ligase [Frankiales bacterium]